MNTESLERANAFLAAVAERVPVGEFLDVSPAVVGAKLGIEEPLAAARAVRALLARRRLESVNGRYRLIDVRPVHPGERESVPRPARKKPAPARRAPGAREPESPARTTYSAIGRETVERLIELGREVGTLRAALRQAKEEARESREARDEAERRAHALAARVHDLEARAEMAESNLRTLVAAARGSGRDEPVGNAEMEAILGVLKGDEQPPPQ